MKIRIATRKSELALWQARHVAEALQKLAEVDAVELVPMVTSGDRARDESLAGIGGKGLFIKELELAMEADKADIAVHSMKDVPAELPAGFCFPALLERGNPFDALVSSKHARITDLPPGAIVGSSSLRRQAQVRAARPDLELQPLRGNVNTRLRRLDQGDYDAIVLACAGLERLGLANRIRERISPALMLPASAQGVIGLECREDRKDLVALLTRLDHPATRQTTVAERAVARVLEASCRSPVASYARLERDLVFLTALVAAPDGSEVLRQDAQGPAQDAEQLGEDVARRLLNLGAARLLGEPDA